MDEEDVEYMKIRIQVEESYQKGFSHGYQVGIETSPNRRQIMKNKIEYWMEEFNESKMKITGAPGTPFEGIILTDLEAESEE